MAENFHLKVRENGPLAYDWQVVDQDGKLVAEGTELSRSDAEAAGKYAIQQMKPPGPWEDVE
jgi:hypothetical protein